MAYKDFDLRMKDKPCGTRGKYVSGCRCADCRRANSEYANKRAKAIVRGKGNPLIEAGPVRKHLRALRRLGIGLRTISDAASVSRSALYYLANGTKTKVRKLTAERILEVDKKAIPDAALIDSKGTLARIAWLLDEGFTKSELALRLGYKNPKLQITGAVITAKVARKVERFYQQMRLGDE